MTLGWPRSWSSCVSSAFTARMVSLGSDAALCRAAVRLSTYIAPPFGAQIEQPVSAGGASSRSKHLYVEHANAAESCKYGVLRDWALDRLSLASSYLL